MHKINVKKLLTIATNVEDGYKMFDNVPEDLDALCKSLEGVSCRSSVLESISVEETIPDVLHNHLVEDVHDDLCDGNKPFNNDLQKNDQPIRYVEDSVFVKNISNRSVQTCEVGVQVDLCECSQKLLKPNTTSPTFLLHHSFNEESDEDVCIPKTRRKCATEKKTKKKSVLFTDKNFDNKGNKNILQRFHTPNPSRIYEVVHSKYSSSEDLSFKSEKHLGVPKNIDRKSTLNISSSEELSFIVEKISQSQNNNNVNKKSILNISSSEELSFMSENHSEIPKKKNNNKKALPNISSSGEFSFISEKQSSVRNDVNKRAFLNISSSEEISFTSENPFKNSADAMQDFPKRGNKFRNFIINSDSELAFSDIPSKNNLISTSVKNAGKMNILSESLTHKSFLASLSSDAEDHLMHPAVKRFVANFHATKTELTQLLYDFYNEKVFNGKLHLHEPIKWNIKLTKTAGYCACGYKAEKERYFRIEMSVKVCDSPDRIRDTLIHEMCHAYVWMEYGEHGGHGSYWRLWARKANIILRDLPPITRCHNYSINTKYMYQCLKCGCKIGRYTKLNKLQCSRCAGTVQLIANNITTNKRI